MSEKPGQTYSEYSGACLHEVLKICANIQSVESLCNSVDVDYNDVYLASDSIDKMISTNGYSTSGNISNSSCTSEESFTNNIIEDNGRISLAYENLHTIPRRIADKFARQTKCLDLSHNNFQNLSFLSFFDELHTLILDRNCNLDVNTFPYLPSLNILWINNCDITNITDWIHRIKRQCPLLEHLSAMGNPGIKSVPALDYLDYIIQLLPKLKYLDGLPSCARNRKILNSNDNNFGFAEHERKLNSISDNQQKFSERASKVSATSTSFRDLFRLKQRKKSYNGRVAAGSNSSSTN